MKSNPLTEREGPSLERKSRDVLKHPEGVVRAVVAMLNSRGGTVVVGQADNLALEPITDAERELERLTSLVHTTIEPRPTRQEVSLWTEEAAGGHVCFVEVREGKRGPYAQRVSGGALAFWTRIGSTTRAREYADVINEIRGRAGGRALEKPRQSWDAELVGLPGPVLLLESRPPDERAIAMKPLELARAVDARRADVETRRFSWAVLRSEDEVRGDPRPGRRVEWGRRDPNAYRKWLRVDMKSGRVTFAAFGAWLAWGGGLPADWREKTIHPGPLVEATRTFQRFLTVLSDVAGWEDRAADVTLGLWSGDGWRIYPGEPSADSWLSPNAHRPRIEGSHHVVREWDGEPSDELAHDLLTDLFDELGYSSDQIPYWRVDKFVFPS